MDTAEEFVGLSPHHLVAKLADMGIYVASESSFYREIRRCTMLTHRERSKSRKNFVAWYNDDHQHRGIRFVTPSQRHDGRESVILAHRHKVYQAARTRKPDRWSEETRNWQPIEVVRLNPGRGIQNVDESGIHKALAA